MNVFDRTPLHQVVPLAAPYVVQVGQCYACNFRCQYCIHALPREKHEFVPDVAFMDFEMYRYAIDDMAAAGWRLKFLRFACLGEPLLHPQIADMVKYTVTKNVAERVDIVTNAALLTEQLSDKLIEAGLSTLRVSINGLSSAEYKENCGVSVDFDRIKRNIAYYFEHCGELKVYVKIIDYMLKGDKKREQTFFDTFRPISHMIDVEHLVPTAKEIDYSKIVENVEMSQTMDGIPVAQCKICPYPFYMLTINPDGKLTPCCSIKSTDILGNVCAENITAAWGEVKDFWKRMLTKGAKGASEVCAKCDFYQYFMFSEDILDGYEEELLSKI